MMDETSLFVKFERDIFNRAPRMGQIVHKVMDIHTATRIDPVEVDVLGVFR